MITAALAGVTCTRSVPAIEAVAVSVAVMVWDPAVASVAEKVAWPLVRVELGGRATPGARSLLVKCTVPA